MQKTGWKTAEEGCRVVEVPGLSMPFSFFNTLFWGCPATATAEDRALMRAHELAHIRQQHSQYVFLM